ncbi:MAG: CPBP family intramembrane metalloprotease [Oceanospirillaceae bacterium]|nr:CPBP family intramembrane metalloprotease [Oceanospirillaceae bacterium]
MDEVDDLADVMPADAPETPESWKRIFTKFVVAEYLMVPIALVMMWVCDLPKADSITGQLRGEDPWSWGVAFGLFATIPMLLSIVLTSMVPWRPLVDLRELVQTKLAPFFRGMPSWALLLIAMGAGFGEEWLFRGFGIQGLVWLLPDVWSPEVVQWTAILIVALVFGAMHALTPMYFSMTFAIGIYLGYLVLLTDSLLPAVVAHGLYDYIALLYIMRLDKDQTLALAVPLAE